MLSSLWMHAQMFFPLLGAMPIVPKAESHLRKDLAAGAHRLSSWFLLTPAIALLPDAVSVMVNLGITWWIAGMADDAVAFVLFCLAILLQIATFQSIGLLISTLFPTKMLIVALLCSAHQCRERSNLNQRHHPGPLPQ